MVGDKGKGCAHGTEKMSEPTHIASHNYNLEMIHEDLIDSYFQLAPAPFSIDKGEKDTVSEPWLRRYCVLLSQVSSL